MDSVTEEEMQKHVSALHDSAYEIGKIVSEADASELGLRKLSNNFLHIEAMLQKEWLIVSASDRTSFLAATASGREFFTLNS